MSSTRTALPPPAVAHRRTSATVTARAWNVSRSGWASAPIRIRSPVDGEAAPWPAKYTNTVPPAFVDRPAASSADTSFSRLTGPVSSVTRSDGMPRV